MFAVRFEIDGGGDGVEAVVDLDDIHFVPEPGGWLQIAAGLLFLVGVRGRRQPSGPKDSLRMRSTGTPRSSSAVWIAAMKPGGPHR